MKTDRELITLVRNWVQAMNRATNATFIFTHGVSDPIRDNAIEPTDDAGNAQAYGEITQIVRGEERSQFELCVQQDEYGVIVTAYLRLSRKTDSSSRLQSCSHRKGSLPGESTRRLIRSCRPA